MIRFLSNIPIFRRVLLAFGLATLIPGMVIVLLGNFYISAFNNQGAAVKISFDAQSLASEEEANLQRMNALLQAKFYQIFASHSDVITDPSLFASGGLVDGEIRALEADFDRNLVIYQNQYELATSPNMSIVRTTLLNDDPGEADQIIQSQQQALNQVIGANGSWLIYKNYQDQEANQLERLQSDLQNGVFYTPAQLKQKYQQDYDILHSAILAFTNLRNNWQQVVQDAVDMGKAVTTVGAAQVQPIFAVTAAAFFLIILVIIGTGFLVNRTITRPLSQLALLTARIAEGKTDARAPVRGRDEIAVVSNAMNNMLNNIVHLMQEAQTQRDRLQARVEKLVSEVCNVGEGDLRVQAEVTSDALGVLADSFNYMVEELSSLVVRVKMMANEVENSTSMTFQSMVQLVSNADMQIQQIGRAAQEVEHMAEVNHQVAERAQSLTLIAQEARNTAASGRESVQQTLEGMTRIQAYVQDTALKVQALGENSREIDNIVGVISTIAQQTNRLALDAAVQAATAGEHGKGFGAVAVDIRRLAERAKEQANIIARIVRGVSEEIDAAAISMKDTERETAIGAQQAAETGAALESIFGVVERQGSEIEIIDQLANHQLQSSNAVVQIMKSVSESTQQSSANTRGAARNMEHLARLAEQLLSSVEAFKLPEGLDHPAALASENGHTANGRANAARPGIVTVTMQPAGRARPGGQQLRAGSGTSGLLGAPGMVQPPVPPPSYPGRHNSGPIAPPAQGQYGGQPPYPVWNNGPITPPTQGQYGGQSPYPGSNSGPLADPAQDQSRQSKLRQTRLRRASGPFERQ